MKNLYSSLFSLISITFFLQACSTINTPENPDWINNLINKFEAEPLGNPPQSIWQYEYKSMIVYYIPPQCCDQFSVLYDKDGNIICAPDGGFTGTGDGRCANFFSERKNEKLIWKDKRK